MRAAVTSRPGQRIVVVALIVAVIGVIVGAHLGGARANVVTPTLQGQVRVGATLVVQRRDRSYAYRWLRCNARGGRCAAIASDHSPRYVLTVADVGHRLRVVVGRGSASATSAPTSVVRAAPSVSSPGERLANCFAAPGACGYPDPAYHNVGPSQPCSALRPQAGLTANLDGQVIKGLNITGRVNVAASNVTFEDDCITVNGDGTIGSYALFISQGAVGTRISYSDISGANDTSASVEVALGNDYKNAGTTADHDYIYNCGECVHGPWTLSDSYVAVGLGAVTNCNVNGSTCPDHYEDVYISDDTFVANHDTLLNPNEQTAEVFGDTDGGAGGPGDNHVTILDSLLAGGGGVVYPAGNATSVGTGTIDIAGDRIARCLTHAVKDVGTGGVNCRGGADQHGFFPQGGYFFVAADIYCGGPGQTWTDNVWDDDDRSIACP